LSIAREVAEVKEEVILKTKPSPIGFLRKYVLCATPIIILLICHYAETINILKPIIGLTRPIAILGLTTIIMIISWVLRSREASASTFLAILISLIYALYDYKVTDLNIFKILKDIAGKLDTGVIIGATLGFTFTCLLTEVYRRSITYTITDLGVHFEGGMLRRQRHFMPYSQIGRFVMEQSIIGKILNYGTIIPVGTAEWGSEYYFRGGGIGMTAERTRELGGGVFYARALKEVSRDPLKCIYGVNNPKQLYEMLVKYAALPLKAELEQVKYLKRLVEKIDEKQA